MTATHESLIKVDGRGRLRYTAEQRASLLAAYDAQEQTGQSHPLRPHPVDPDRSLSGRRQDRDRQSRGRGTIRPTKLGANNPPSPRLRRPGWLFIGCREAGQKAAVLYTIVDNCRRLGINTREYLEDVLTRLPGMLASEAEQLTPASWLRARQSKAQRNAA